MGLYGYGNEDSLLKNFQVISRSSLAANDIDSLNLELFYFLLRKQILQTLLWNWAVTSALPSAIKGNITQFSNIVYQKCKYVGCAFNLVKNKLISNTFNDNA